MVQATAGSSPESRKALSELCADYWYPLYAFARSRTANREDARDLTQAFFAELLEKDRVSFADPERGRFRTFLLTALENFMHNHWRKMNRAIRGGNVQHFSIDFDDGERRYEFEPQDSLSPADLFERRWAITILDQSISRVRQSYEESGKLELFERLKPHVSGSDDRVPYAEIAAELEMTDSAVKVSAHRLRQKCRDSLRAEIAETVGNDSEIDDELKHLMTAVQKN